MAIPPRRPPTSYTPGVRDDILDFPFNYQQQDSPTVKRTKPKKAKKRKTLSEFQEAFKAARKKYGGPGGIFEFKGKKYTTEYKEEKKARLEKGLSYEEAYMKEASPKAPSVKEKPKSPPMEMSHEPGMKEKPETSMGKEGSKSVSRPTQSYSNVGDYIGKEETMTSIFRGASLGPRQSNKASSEPTRRTLSKPSSQARSASTTGSTNPHIESIQKYLIEPEKRFLDRMVNAVAVKDRGGERPITKFVDKSKKFLKDVRETGLRAAPEYSSSVMEVPKGEPPLTSIKRAAGKAKEYATDLTDYAKNIDFKGYMKGVRETGLRAAPEYSTMPRNRQQSRSSSSSTPGDPFFTPKARAELERLGFPANKEVLDLMPSQSTERYFENPQLQEYEKNEFLERLRTNAVTAGLIAGAGYLGLRAIKNRKTFGRNIFGKLRNIKGKFGRSSRKRIEEELSDFDRIDHEVPQLPLEEPSDKAMAKAIEKAMNGERQSSTAQAAVGKGKNLHLEEPGSPEVRREEILARADELREIGDVQPKPRRRKVRPSKKEREAAEEIIEKAEKVSAAPTTKKKTTRKKTTSKKAVEMPKEESVSSAAPTTRKKTTRKKRATIAEKVKEESIPSAKSTTKKKTTSKKAVEMPKEESVSVAPPTRKKTTRKKRATISEKVKKESVSSRPSGEGPSDEELRRIEESSGTNVLSREDLKKYSYYERLISEGTPLDPEEELEYQILKTLVKP